MSITLVAAVSDNNCIGKDGKLPWGRIEEDIEQMKKDTVGRVVIMGRKTWESIPPEFQPLPDRTNIVITSNVEYNLPDGVEKYKTINEALEVHPEEEVIGFGGQQIYEELIKKADTLKITEIHQTINDCGTFFPVIDKSIWQEVSRDDRDNISFVTYKRYE